MDKLATDWTIGNWPRYVVLVVLFSLAIRVLMSCLRGIVVAHRSSGTLQDFLPFAWQSFIGFHAEDTARTQSDYWYPTILGTLELASYPIMMATGAWEAIGAWIGLKTLAQWRVWGTDRVVFNRFLIGTALTVLISLLFLVGEVTIVKKP